MVIKKHLLPLTIIIEMNTFINYFFLHIQYLMIYKNK